MAPNTRSQTEGDDYSPSKQQRTHAPDGTEPSNEMYEESDDEMEGVPGADAVNKTDAAAKSSLPGTAASTHNPQNPTDSVPLSSTVIKQYRDFGRLICQRLKEGSGYVWDTFEDPAAVPLKPTIPGGFLKLPPFRTDEIDSGPTPIPGKTPPRRKRKLIIPAGHQRMLLHSQFPIRNAVAKDEALTQLMTQLGKYIVHTGMDVIEAEQLIARTPALIHQVASLRVADIQWPATAPPIKGFRPVIGGKPAHWEGKGSYLAQHFATIQICTLYPVSTLLDRLAILLRPFASPVEVWQVGRQDRSESATSFTIVNDHKFRVLIELYNSSRQLCRFAQETLVQLPGWITIGAELIELEYLHRFPYCTVCRLEYQERHSRRDCPIDVCDVCKQRGHYRRDCPDLANEDATPFSTKCYE